MSKRTLSNLRSLLGISAQNIIPQICSPTHPCPCPSPVSFAYRPLPWRKAVCPASLFFQYSIAVSFILSQFSVVTAFLIQNLIYKHPYWLLIHKVSVIYFTWLLLEYALFSHIASTLPIHGQCSLPGIQKLADTQ